MSGDKLRAPMSTTLSAEELALVMAVKLCGHCNDQGMIDYSRERSLPCNWHGGLPKSALPFAKALLEAQEALENAEKAARLVCDGPETPCMRHEVLSTSHGVDCPLPEIRRALTSLRALTMKEKK